MLIFRNNSNDLFSAPFPNNNWLIAHAEKSSLSPTKLFLIFHDEPEMLTSLPGPEVIKLFSCSTQLSMTFFLLINVKMPTIVGILTFMNRKNSIPGLSEPEKC